MYNRIDVKGLREHPLYRGLNFGGFEKLNSDFGHLQVDFQEHLALHVMCNRMLQVDSQMRRYWQEKWTKHDACISALKLQVLAKDLPQNSSIAELLLSKESNVDAELQHSPLIKLSTAQYEPLLYLARSELLDGQTPLGRLLRGS